MTGLYKPEQDDFKIIKKDGALTNNEVADAFIVANAVRVFAKDLIQPSIQFPKNDSSLPDHSLPWINHLRVSVDASTGQVNSYLSNPNIVPSTATPNPYVPSDPTLIAPTRFMSVWEHVIRDTNDNCSKPNVEDSEQVKIELIGKKACDVYGFKFR